MTPDREKELLRRVDQLENAIVVILWVGGAALVALLLHVFFGHSA
jgi:hypothetical protein